jgi:hypothetical protein
MAPTARLSFVLIALVLAAAAVSVQGQSTTGGFHYGLAGASGAVQFEARMQGSSGSGHVDLTGTQAVSNDSGDDTGGSEATQTTVSVRVDVDCLRVSGNRAVMSGSIVSATIPGYIGAQAILAVEDGGEGGNAAPDRFTWGLYHVNDPTWTPSDAEVPGDAGAFFSWIATDAERPDDVGIPAGADAPTGVDCTTFSLDAYAFEPIGNGNLQVRP